MENQNISSISNIDAKSILIPNNLASNFLVKISVVAALCFGLYYLQLIDVSSFIKRLFQKISPKPSLEDQISDFKTQHEKKYFSQDVLTKHFLAEAYDKAYKTVFENLDTKTLEARLDQCLASKSDYVASINDVLEVAAMALHLVVSGSPNEEIKENKHRFAKTIYKKLSLFLRKETTPSVWIARNHQEYIQNKWYCQSCLITERPSSYLQVDREVEQSHCAVMYLLKHLRKQIKLFNLEKIVSKVKDLNLNLKEEEQVAALDCLRLTWMHGTKAFVLLSALHYSKGEILPAGELKNRNVSILSGELEVGNTCSGVNQKNISGVNLLEASKSLEYANKFTFSLDNEKERFEHIINYEFKKWNDFSDYQGHFYRSTIVSFERILKCEPNRSEELKEKLKRKLNEIKQGLSLYIFEQKPSKLFGEKAEYCYVDCFYKFLKVIEKLESLVDQPTGNISKITSDEEMLTKIPIVLATKNRYGIPAPLRTCEEPAEEIYPEKLALGQEITTVFTESEHESKVKNILIRFQLENKVEVKSIQILKKASEIDKLMGPYFYDVYNLEKWQKMHGKV